MIRAAVIADIPQIRLRFHHPEGKGWEPAGMRGPKELKFEMSFSRWINM